MSFESILEQQRRAHEERERTLDTMTKEMLRKKATHRDQINSEHMIKLLLDRYSEISARLKDSYDDKNGSRKAEIQALSGPNEFTEFYLRLKQIDQYYAKNQSEETAIPMSIEYEQLMRQLQETEDGEPIALASFTDEEGYGRFLDLHEPYSFYLNIKGIEKIDYLTYLQTFDRFETLSKERKNHEYRQYLFDHLFSYLIDFLKRCKPLMNIEKELMNVRHDFELRWEQGIVPGWPKEAGGALAKSGAPLDLSGFSSAEELASVGLDRLKSALLALGMKCGGTLEERAKRLFSTKDKSVEDLDPSLFMKDNKSKRENKDSTRNKEIAGMEVQIHRLVELLSEQRAATLDNVRRKQAKAGEDNDDDEDADGGNISDDDSNHEEDGLIYNPKNLPLGWDGKPIPYWLYKLHGLNMYFSCEICGNHTYRGPKAFQRHFAEWRHAHGMRCLGIPNTAHFANITSIEDALSLWKKIKNSKDDERWKPDTEEEFEDSMGNVVNKRTYDDLRKQGLL